MLVDSRAGTDDDALQSDAPSIYAPLRGLSTPVSPQSIFIVDFKPMA